MKRIINFLNLKIFSGAERTVVVKKNIIGSFGIKGLSILTSLLLIPLTIHLLDQEKYGIWITIFSIVSWFNMMDVGIGNGFRNKFTEALAHKKNELAKEYVQTLYSSMAIIALCFITVFSVLNVFLNWQTILNLPENFDENIGQIVWWIFALFCVQLYLKSVSTILLSMQKTTFSNALLLMGNIVALLFILIFQEIQLISLLTISISFMSGPIIVFLCATFYIFSRELKEFKPELFTLPKKEYLKDLVGLGLKFFFIQITSIIMFASSNLIITQLYGPADVTPYNVAFRLFSSIQALFIIIITPFWSAFTEANAKKDFVWIKKSISRLVIIWSLFSVGILIFWIISPFIFKIWLGNDVIISQALTFQFALYTILMSFLSIFSFFLAGIGKISISLYLGIFQSIINIPLAIFLAENMNFNIIGIIMAININLLFPVILLPLQTNLILKNNAHGIWNK